MHLDELAYHALVILVTRFKDAGIRPNLPMCGEAEANIRRMVDVGRQPNALDGVRTLADDLLKCRVERFAELTSRNMSPGVNTRIITDTTSGICLRLTINQFGLVFDAAGIGDPLRRFDA